jgi:hypothetical protein
VITAEQIRGARGLLRWSAARLAKEAAVSLQTIQRMEAVVGVPRSHTKNLEAVQLVLENSGVRFISENGGGVGVRFRHRSH